MMIKKRARLRGKVEVLVQFAGGLTLVRVVASAIVMALSRPTRQGHVGRSLDCTETVPAAVQIPAGCFCLLRLAETLFLHTGTEGSSMKACCFVATVVTR